MAQPRGPSSEALLADAVPVGQFVHGLRRLLKEEPTLQRQSIRGEISRWSRARSGHVYLTLRDDDGAIDACSTEEGNPIIVRYRAANPGEDVLENCVLTDSNTAVLPNPEPIGPITTGFDNFIFQQATGREVSDEGDFPVPAGEHEMTEREYLGVDAEFYGFELSAETEVYNADGKSIMLRAMADYTRAKNETEGENLPRISPFRIGGELEYTQGSFIGSVQVRHAFEQDDFAPEESETPDYTLLNLRGSYAIPQGDNLLELFIEGNNLTDELAYISTSFRKDSAPLPGRSINVGLNYSF